MSQTFQIAGYCRISVDEELDRENTSIENQKSIISDYIAKTFPGSELTFYEDRDRSGYTFEQREGYQKMRPLLMSRHYDILVVKDFSRFSRRNSRGLVELEDLRDEQTELADGLDAVSDDLEDVEDVVFDDEDEDDEDCYATTCPTCGETIYFDETILEDGEVLCPNCGEKLEFDLDEVEDEVSAEEEPEDQE